MARQKQTPQRNAGANKLRQWKRGQQSRLGVRLSPAAEQVLQRASQQFLAQLLEDALDRARICQRDTLEDGDIRLALRLRGQ